MVRGNGSARAETSVNATARPNTMRITIRCGPLRDSLDDDLSTIIIPSADIRRRSRSTRRAYRSHRLRSLRPACGYNTQCRGKKRGWRPGEHHPLEFQDSVTGPINDVHLARRAPELTRRMQAVHWHHMVW